MTKQVKCVVENSSLNIIKGKIYNVIEENYLCYKITDDSNNVKFISKGLFEEIKKGKFVKCVSKHPKNQNLTINKIYEVINEYTYTYSIVNDNGKELQYYKSIFEEIKQRKFVKCVYTYDYTLYLTIGKIYEVTKDYNHIYSIINDNNKERLYIKNIFEEVCPNTDNDIEESNKMPKYIMCIDNENFEDYLTLNKVYEVNYNFPNIFGYFITNDKNNIESYCKDRFVEVDNIEKPSKFVKITCSNVDVNIDIEEGKIFEVLDETHDSYKIKLDEKCEGWVHRDNFDVVEKTSLHRDNIHQTQKYKFVPESDITEATVDGIKGFLIKE